MNSKEFFQKISESSRPVIVDFWAPWCGPCRMVKPILEKLAAQYEGRVDLWQINADESQELIRELKIFGIPTLIVFKDGKEAAREVGAKPAPALESLFETLAAGGDPAPAGISTIDRFIRMGIGMALLIFSISNQAAWPVYLVSGLLMFSAVHDRCPIWKMAGNAFRKIGAHA